MKVVGDVKVKDVLEKVALVNTQGQGDDSLRLEVKTLTDEMAGWTAGVTERQAEIGQ